MMRISTLALLLLSPIGFAYGQGLHAVSPMPGYVCMQLTLTPAQLTDPKVGAPVREGPSRSSQILAYAANTMIVQWPQKPADGFLEVVWPGGRSGWMEAGYLRPWRNPFVPSDRCVPSIMSNGKPGFGSGH